MRSSSLPNSLKDLYDSVTSLLESEIRLARTELHYGVKDSARQVKTIGFCSALAAPGLLTFLAFLVIGLGNILGKNYWLSSLIVSVIFLLPAVLMANHSLRKISEDARLRETRECMNQNKATLTNAVSRIRRIP